MTGSLARIWAARFAFAAACAAPLACGDSADDGATGAGGGDGGSATTGSTSSNTTGAGLGGEGGGAADEVCDNTVDDDGDRAVDCEDSDCAADVASCWTCEPTWYDEEPPAQEFCDCACGLPDPDCMNPALPVFGCDTGLSCEAGLCVPIVGEICANGIDDEMDGVADCDDQECFGELGCPPAGWTCQADFYDEDPSNEYCDCDCGVVDADCANPNAPEVGCPLGSVCSDTGACVPAPTEVCDNGIDDDIDLARDCDDLDCLGEPGCPPAGWTCDPAWHDEEPPGQQFCDCSCGAVDPDCSDETLPDFGCSPGQVCNAAGQCVATMTEDCDNGVDDDGDSAPDCDDSDCIGEVGCPPASWTCLPTAYDQSPPNETCDCDCGALDPDCATAGGPGAGCETGELCSASGDCVLIVGEQCQNTVDDDGDTLVDCFDQECWGQSGCVPPGWVCNPSLYDESTVNPGCDCSCGAHDPDCDSPTSTLYGCQSFQTCSPEGECEVVVPNAWSCAAGYFGSEDGCDCGCGVVDPDCDDASVGSCEFCSDAGSCSTGGCPGTIHPTNNGVCQ